MLLTVSGHLAAFDIEGRGPSARVLRITLGADVDHAVLSMSPAIRSRFAALNIERGNSRAREM